MNIRRYKKVSEAEIQKQIAEDPDDFELTGADAANAKSFDEVFPELAANMRKNVGGRPKADNPKVAVSIRLNPDTLAKFKATGKGWQSRISDALDKAAR